MTTQQHIILKNVGIAENKPFRLSKPFEEIYISDGFSFSFGLCCFVILSFCYSPLMSVCRSAVHHWHLLPSTVLFVLAK